MTQIRKNARLKNMALLMGTVEQVINRAPHLPGMIDFHGPSGFGKSHAAAYVANHYNCYYVQAQSSWTKKALLLAMLSEMGIQPAKTIYELVAQIVEQLVLSERPLIIDEMDHIVDKKMVEIVRDIYDASQSAIILIGEENLPNKLKKWERFHGRMLNFVPALAADFEDAKELRKIYCDGVEISDDLLKQIQQLARGSVRRICVNLERIQQFCKTQNWKQIDLATWTETKNGYFTGEAPTRRV